MSYLQLFFSIIYFFYNFQAADVFIKDACSLLGINKDSPLSVVINTGCTALPALLNLKQVMMSRQVTGIWNGRDELPVSLKFAKKKKRNFKMLDIRESYLKSNSFTLLNRAFS